MIETIKKAVQEKLKDHPNRLVHVMGVYETSTKLAKIYGLDVEKVGIAALYHDYAKYDTIEEQIKYLDLATIKAYAETPVIYHGFAAAESLEHHFKIHDEEILNAIKYHVWGRIGMSDVEKVVFISDSCEPSRKFYEAKVICKLAEKNLDLAVEAAMKASIDYLIEKEIVPSQEQMEIYTYYVEVNRGKTR